MKLDTVSIMSPIKTNGSFGTNTNHLCLLQLEYAKHEFFKPVAERIEDLRAKKKQEHDELMAHQRLIGERMAQMPEFIAKYEVKKEKRSEKNTEAVSTMPIISLCYYGYLLV